MIENRFMVYSTLSQIFEPNEYLHVGTVKYTAERSSHSFDLKNNLTKKQIVFK